MGNNIIVRRALPGDFAVISGFLYAIAEQHRQGRPDIFKENVQKYSFEEFQNILNDKASPVFVAADEYSGEIYAHAFCKIKVNEERSVAYGWKSLFIDDLYVDSSVRNSGLGTLVMDHLKEFAAALGCYNIELNVWEFNDHAITFYQNRGFYTQRRQMEFILSGESK